jgi:xylose isomerase
MNRNDYQSGWDTDQFPNSVPEVALAYYEILKAGGFDTGGTNFDAKIRRQSLDPADLVAAHIGAMDVCARGLKAAAAMLNDGGLEAARTARYAGWDTAQAKTMLSGGLDGCYDHVIDNAVSPQPRSGQQERLENLVNRFVQNRGGCTARFVVQIRRKVFYRSFFADKKRMQWPPIFSSTAPSLPPPIIPWAGCSRNRRG